MTLPHLQDESGYASWRRHDQRIPISEGHGTRPPAGLEIESIWSRRREKRENARSRGLEPERTHDRGVVGTGPERGDSDLQRVATLAKHEEPRSPVRERDTIKVDPAAKRLQRIEDRRRAGVARRG